ncbi:MAG: macro domain-containing protein [Anaerolineales bacterium]
MSEILRQTKLSPKLTLHLVQGDITRQEVGGVVNAANERLQHGGGVAAAIARAGGPAIQAESNRWVEKHGPVSHANPAFTSGGEMPCQYVIHAVGPRWGSGDEDDKLEKAVLGSLRLADDLDLRSMAFPAISTGIFGFPKKRAAKVILHAVETYASQHPESGLNEVRIVLFDEPTAQAFSDVWDQHMS